MLTDKVQRLEHQRAYGFYGAAGVLADLDMLRDERTEEIVQRSGQRRRDIVGIAERPGHLYLAQGNPSGVKPEVADCRVLAR